ncbi:golgin subfamily A member 4-like isoform X2 [Gossypium australe]|uniref:Golgin subfamily A member 4-like isoform X2 n=1 Tax=Gossypium australe TaxID=47621 RepID=A0A5B6UN43_9ROSI|nr:golgin subfamily A member 4-like isoform X2 [Gossypium australe]
MNKISLMGASSSNSMCNDVVSPVSHAPIHAKKDWQIGGALLSTLLVHLGYKLKQALNTKQQHEASTRSKDNHDPCG